jgi:hypothetical protein
VTTVEEIEAAVNNLPEAEFRELLRRMKERAAEAWDRQIEEDSKTGRLDFLLDELEGDIAAGRTKPLDEVCGEP